MICNRVDFPHPEGPTMDTSSALDGEIDVLQRGRRVAGAAKAFAGRDPAGTTGPGPSSTIRSGNHQHRMEIESAS